MNLQHELIDAIVAHNEQYVADLLQRGADSNGTIDDALLRTLALCDTR